MGTHYFAGLKTIIFPCWDMMRFDTRCVSKRWIPRCQKLGSSLGTCFLASLVVVFSAKTRALRKWLHHEAAIQKNRV